MPVTEALLGELARIWVWVSAISLAAQFLIWILTQEKKEDQK